jgi:diaminopimelate decarboxylase
VHHFTYREDQLYCEDVPVRRIAAAIGTPFYLYSYATLTRHLAAFKEAFGEIDHLICFSAKANTNLAILKLFMTRGCGLDIVSGGELYRGLQAGFAPDRIVYSGVGKRMDEIDDALKAGILMFNLESVDELKLIDQRAGKLKRRARVAIRVNPDVDPKTHPYISTGLKKINSVSTPKRLSQGTGWLPDSKILKSSESIVILAPRSPKPVLLKMRSKMLSL